MLRLKRFLIVPIVVPLLMFGSNISAQQKDGGSRWLQMEVGPFLFSPHVGVFSGGGNLFEENQECSSENGKMCGFGGALLLSFGERGRGRFGIDVGYDASIGSRRLIRWEGVYWRDGVAGDLEGKHLRQNMLYLTSVFGTVSESGDWEFRGGIGPSWNRTTTNVWENPESLISYDQMGGGLSIIGMMGYRLLSMRFEAHFTASNVHHKYQYDEWSSPYSVDTFWWGITIGR